MTKLVSVIIPTYNRAGIIGATIRNVFEQTYRNFEVVVIDDGSTDETQRVLKRFGGEIRVISQANAGPAAARNAGLEAARGEIIAFQDSDDSWMPTKLERQVSLLDRLGPSAACCLCNAWMEYTGQPRKTSFWRAGIHPPDEEGIWTNVPEVLAGTFVLFNQCAAMRADVLRRLGGFDESMKLMEDYDLPLRLAIESSTWAYLREPMVTWRQGSPNSIFQSAIGQEMRVKEYLIRARQSALTSVASSTEHRRFSALLTRELHHDFRVLAIARFCRRSALASFAGRVLRKLEHYANAIGRRISGVPRAEFQSLESNSL